MLAIRHNIAGRAVAALTTLLGFGYIVDAILFWQNDNLSHFVLYLLTGIAASIFMGWKGSEQTSFSVNLFLVPLGIVELTLPETILLAVIGGASSTLTSNKARWTRDSIVQLAHEATAAAAASFAFHSLIHGGGRTATVRLFLGSAAYFVTRTFPKAVLAATSSGHRIVETWKKDYFWSFPFYLVGASTAGFLSIRNAFVHWEACLLTVPVFYTLYRAHLARESTVTVLQQRTRQLEAAKVQAEAASRAKSEFLANISHELRTPMNGILGMTAVALESDPSPDVRDQLETVKGCADSLLRLLNELLDFSKIEAGKLELEQIEFSLRKLVDTACRPLQPVAAGKGVKLDWQVSGEIPDTLIGDPFRLTQVIVNLLGNALKFTPEGQIELRVSAPADAADSAALHFVVRDTGIGIPLDNQKDIFEAFTQADGSMTRNYGGTGLGLAICSRLVEKMGGRIWVESAPGAGSAFHFTCQLGRFEPKGETAPRLAAPLRS